MRQLLVLRSGDRLAWTSAELKLKLDSAAGRIDLPAENIASIESGGGGGGRHRVRLRNGSWLSGKLLPEKLTAKLKLGPELTVGWAELTRLTRAVDRVLPAGTAVVRLRSGDHLFGRIIDESLTVRTKFGEAKVEAESLKSMQVEREPTGLKVTVRTWEGATLAGPLAAAAVAFRIAPGGPTLSVPVAQIADLSRPSVLLPPKLAKKARLLIAQLGAESYKDREAATKALEAIGRRIVPLLRRYRDNGDPEIRVRIEHLLDKLTEKPAPPKPKPKSPRLNRGGAAIDLNGARELEVL